MDYRHRPRSHRGSLPFSAVAVTILIVVSAYAAAAELMTDNEGSADNLMEYSSAVESAVSDITSAVEQGIGEILHSASTQSGLGDESARKAWFGERAAEWMDFMFPMVSKGVRAELISFDIGVYEKQLKTGLTSGSGYIPAYLEASGTFTAEYECHAGNVERTVDVKADGSCALPLVEGQGSLFEVAVDGDGSLLTQMMTYQLTSMAQFRVMNGYGAFSQYGDKGTYSVIKEEDVRRSYESCLKALSAIYFRDGSGGYAGTLDLAEAIVGKDSGLDLSSVYAQALYSKVDDIVAKWFDYFLGTKVLEVCEYITDSLKNAWDSLCSFFTGENKRSAEPYIREILKGDEDLDLRTGDFFVYTVNDGDFSMMYAFKYPAVDIMGSDVVQDFKEDYRKNTDSIRGWLRTIVNSAVRSVADSHRLDTVTVDCSGTPFPEALEKAALRAMEGAEIGFWDCLTEKIGSNKFPDQFYCAIYDALYSEKDNILSYSKEAFIRNTIPVDFRDRVYAHALTLMGDEEVAKGIADRAAASLFEGENAHVYEEYRDCCDLLLSQLSALRDVESSGSSIIERGCIGIVKAGMLIGDVSLDVSPQIKKICSEFSSNILANGVNYPVEIPGEGPFVLGEGFSETLASKIAFSHPSVSVGRPDSSRCTHDTGFSDTTAASYCTVIPVDIKDAFVVKITSTGGMAETLGKPDTVYTFSVDIDTNIPVTVVSGYALAGVSYSPSTDIAQDLKTAIMKVFTPYIDDLKMMMGMAALSFTKIADAAAVLGRYMTDIGMDVYEKLIVPLERIASRIGEATSNSLCKTSVELAERISAIVDVGLKSQTVGIKYMGFELTFKFFLTTIASNTKHVVEVALSGPLGGATISASIDLKVKGSNYEPIVTGKFSMVSGDWNVHGVIDPFMKNGSSLATMYGTVRGVDFDLVFPKYVEYHELGISLQDVPALGTVLRNIPFVIPGTKISLDAGIDIKYDAPVVHGIMVNEFEPNPAGNDTDKEWAEILNLTAGKVDLNGWKVTTSRGKVYEIENTVLAPGERTVLNFPGIFLMNNDEFLILSDPGGKAMDTTPLVSDSANNSKTFQRQIDGCTDWRMGDGSEGSPNTGSILGKDGIAMGIVKDIVAGSAKEALHDVGKVNDTESLSKLIGLTLQYSIDKGIDELSNCLVEASVYVEVEVTDASSSGHAGFRIYVSAGKEMAADVLKYIVGRAESMVMNIEDPYRIDLGDAAKDDIFLGVSAYGEVSAPRVFRDAGGARVEVAADVCCNLSAIGALLGHDVGTPEVRAGIVVKGAGPALLSAHHTGSGKDVDIWLLKMTFRPHRG